MADYATLVHHIKKRLNTYSSAVIGFGGSYGGMLAVGATKDDGCASMIERAARCRNANRWNPRLMPQSLDVAVFPWCGRGGHAFSKIARPFLA